MHPTDQRTAAVVAWYAAEPPALARLRSWLHCSLAAALGDTFRPRPAGTLHTTVIGLDAVAPLAEGGEVDQLRRADGVDVPGLARRLTNRLESDPLVVQVGGYPDRDLPVTSRGRRPYRRSLACDPRRRQVLMVGWPVTGGLPTTRLDRLRHELEGYGVRHRYAAAPVWQDPDAHLVVGELDAVPEDVDGLLDPLRAELATRPTRIPLTPGDLSVVVYSDPRLPVTTTTRVPLAGLG